MYKTLQEIYRAQGHKEESPSADSATINIDVERETIVVELLRTLSKIDQHNMEPNGSSFTNKIRDIASTLVEATSERNGDIATRAQEHLKAFMDILLQLECGGGEEKEFQAWADLREYQVKFMESGGFSMLQ